MWGNIPAWRPWSACRPGGAGPVQRFRRYLLPAAGLTQGAVLAGLVSAATLIPASGKALTWSVVPSPNNPGYDILDAVSCASPAHCMGVGYYGGHGSPESALAESWNGTNWSLVPTPSPRLRALYGISCVAATSCIAVGSANLNPNFTQNQLIELWNGSKWSVMRTSPVISSDLYAVSCVSATDCTAVGDQSVTAQSRTFIESWNGTSWSPVRSPSTRSGDDFLNGVSCTSATACMAVGDAFTSDLSGDAPLTESWNGTSWSIVPAPNEDNEGSLHAVSCGSARSCFAVGYYLDRSADFKSLIEAWNGTRWTAEPALNKGHNELAGVSCVSTADCWAVGNRWNKDFNPRTYAESWNGTSWSVVPTPNRGSARLGNILRAVSCGAASGCAAVGNDDNRPVKTLTLIGTG